jgi:hypothetical protein
MLARLASLRLYLPAARRIRPALPFGFSRRYTRGDAALAAGGLVLGLTCAFFPWYVFYNQDQFGIRAYKFSGDPAGGPPPIGATPAGAIDDPLPASLSAAALDAVTTGTLPRELDEIRPLPGLEDQPFPAAAPPFELVHIANGRAMIEDAEGLWIVQPGSILPDSSRVTAIEQREGRWVMVTTGERVIGLAR